jgi:hypothetical protein
VADGSVYRLDADLSPDGRLFAAWVWINGNRPTKLVLDTLAEQTVLMRRVLAELRLGPFVTAAPLAPAEPPMYRLERVEMGQYWLHGPVVGATDRISGPEGVEELQVEGILGLDWLTDYFEMACLNFDFERPSLDVRPRPS